MNERDRKALLRKVRAAETVVVPHGAAPDTKKVTSHRIFEIERRYRAAVQAANEAARDLDAALEEYEFRQ